MFDQPQNMQNQEQDGGLETQFNRSTGQFEAVPSSAVSANAPNTEQTTEAFTQAAQAAIRPPGPPGELRPIGVGATGNPMHRSYFEDDDLDDGSYSSIISFDGKAVYINELDNKQYKKYQTEQKNIQSAMKNLQRLTATENADEEADLLTERQLALYTWVITQAVVKWKLPRAYSTELAAKMRPSAKSELCNLIIQKSRLGKAESDFLSPRSST